MAALLASHGYVTLVAAYMGEPGLPPALKEIPIEVVGEALSKLEAMAGPSAVIAASVGTQGALAALAHGAAAPTRAVAIAPSSVVWQALPDNGRPPRTAAWSHGGEPLPWLAMHGERILPEMIEHSLLDRLSRHPRPHALHMLPAYGAGHFLRPPIIPTTVPWDDTLVSGGGAEGNARAQAEGWSAILAFLEGRPH